MRIYLEEGKSKGRCLLLESNVSLEGMFARSHW
jgi:hypothetical protein